MIDLGKIKQGERGTLLFTWEFPPALSSPASISGGVITAVAHNLDTKDITEITGTLTPTGATSATWALSAEDSGTAGDYLITFQAVVGGVTTYTLNASLEIEVNPSATAVAPPAIVGVTVDDAAWVAAGSAGGALGDAAYEGVADLPFDDEGAAAAAQVASMPRNQVVVAVNGDHATVGAALAAATSGSVVMVDANTSEATATLTIPTGVTVRILPGRTVTYSGADVVFLATSSTSRLFDGIGEIVLLPSTWTWNDHGLLIRKNSRGGYEIGKYPDVSTWDYPASPNIAYVDGTAGNNSNSGLTWALAKKGIRYAFSMSPAPDIIYIRAGVYSDGDQAWSTWKLVNDCALIGVGGKAIISYHKSAADASWAVDGTYANTYSATIGNVYDVRDALYPDVFGDYPQLTLVADAATVDATPNSWYTTGGTVWIRLRDGRVPDDYVRPYRNNTQATRAENITLKLENVEIHGGATGLSFEDNGFLYMLNSAVKYAYGNNFATWPSLAILDNVSTTDAGDDGISYKKDLGAAAPKVIEINCRGARCGEGIADTVNKCSTGHNGTLSIRVNGDYQRSGGRVIHDIDEGTQSVLIGCKVGQSSSQSNGASVGCTSSSENGNMWLIGCDLSGSEYDADAVSANSNIYAHDTIINRSKGNGGVAAW